MANDRGGQMNLEKFKLKCLRTWKKKNCKMDRINEAMLGIAGEAGELAEWIKHKYYHNDKSIQINAISEEIGDLLYYIAVLSDELDINLDYVLEKNIEKLRLRYPNGYNDEDSKLRKDKIIDTNDYEYTPF